MTDEPLVIEIQGLDKVRANLRNLYLKAPAEFGQAVRDEMDSAMVESQAECPYDYDNNHADGTPHLRDTANVEGPEDIGDGVVITLSYGTPYAAIQHENPEYRHLYPTKWKYLEDPVNRHIPRIAPAIITRTQAIIEGTPINKYFTSPYAIRKDYSAAQEAFKVAQIAKYGHLAGRYL